MVEGNKSFGWDPEVWQRAIRVLLLWLVGVDNTFARTVTRGDRGRGDTSLRGSHSVERCGKWRLTGCRSGWLLLTATEILNEDDLFWPANYQPQAQCENKRPLMRPGPRFLQQSGSLSWAESGGSSHWVTVTEEVNPSSLESQQVLDKGEGRAPEIWSVHVWMWNPRCPRRRDRDELTSVSTSRAAPTCFHKLCDLKQLRRQKPGTQVSAMCFVPEASEKGFFLPVPPPASGGCWCSLAWYRSHSILCFSYHVAAFCPLSCVSSFLIKTHVILG